MKSILDEPFKKTKKKGNSKTFTLISLVLLSLFVVQSFSNVISVKSHFHFNNPHKDKVNTKAKKNVIMMVTDGMGPASLSLTRSFRQFTDDLPINDILTIDKHLIGSSRTRSSSSLVTDSAAGATAFSCGLKSYNGAIGVDPSKSPCGTILEGLKLQGYLTGLVVTTRITDATPAAFSSHVNYRWQEDLIAQHQLGESPLGRVVDLIIGGGRTHFYPIAEGGSRTDGRNLIKEYSKTWNYVGNRQEFDELNSGENVTLPLLGLLADYDIPYDLDRDSKEYPSLAEQTRTALRALSKATEDSDQGFFLLIEGSRIDHAGHANDPSAQVREVLAYDEAFKEVLDFIDSSDVETVAISTSDHETGGLVTARQINSNYPDYLWYPEVLFNSKHSGEYLAHKILTQKSNTESVEDFLVKVFEEDMGIKNFSKEELQLVKNTNDASELMYILNNMISIRSQTGWTTHGHSAVDVNIYAYTNSPSIKEKLYSHKENVGLLGNHENIEIGKFMANITGVDFEEITKKIKGIEHNPLEVEQFSIDNYHPSFNDIN
ncbi:repressible alkaline phosphatase [[Candida] jaroonii]|uniref:Repressible alkaline phosphatase n=1 Tax=[Candida] jaroonii TaxID=467808 RepID=A0ACA9YBV1_9ASCO|nr:repressible alkaline phosphatase [[Candida] jaroonii]